MSSGAEDGSPSPEPAPELDSSIMTDVKAEGASSEEKSPSQASNGHGQPSKSNSKDPSRPRRKKARRACFACQRAHLTCGDERPCERCIKRGLADQCHDGVRKKAKYLHDAPPEALVPGFTANYLNGGHLSTVSGAAPVTTNTAPVSQTSFYPQTMPTNFPPYNPVTHGHMAPPMTDSAQNVSNFTGQTHVGTPPQYQSNPSQQVSPAQDMSNPLDPGTVLGGAAGSYDANMFDTNDPALFNLSDFNFGNHYGALEFGMLGHMSGAVGTPEMDIVNPIGSFDSSSGFTGAYSFNPTLPSWQMMPTAGSRQSSTSNVWTSSGMDAFAIGDHSSMGQSPHSQGHNMSPEHTYNQPEYKDQQEYLRQSISTAQQQRKPSAFPGHPTQDPSRKRRRDTSEIYTSVQAPYSYTQGFHSLIALLQKRYPTSKVTKIAKSLAAIRPSFIACNQSLNRDDLIFMEKCLQRTLCEYEEFINHYGTPTIICRRTGEIAAVSKEFSLVTGWRRDVLLGKEPNLNVNTGGSSSGTETGSSSRGAATPRLPNVQIDPGRPQPVFLAELMDADSVVQFYEDFANIAFGASRDAIIGDTCSLLKYRTKNDPGWGATEETLAEDGSTVKRQEVKDEGLIKGEAGMKTLGEGDGRVECSMCWTVKRDVFDIPMLIVMNFLPII